MSTKAIEILTPVGRLVQGDCFEPQTTDAEGKPLVVKNGPNVGQPRVDYFMAIAVPKTDPGWAELWGKIHGAARQAFPSLFDTQGNCINPKFAFKVTDGDSQVPNSRGTKPCDREGFPGHWILNFSGGFAPKCYTKGGAAQIINPEELKRGYFIRIYGTVKSNGSQQQPGIFLNHSMVELCGYGEEIHSGPDGAAVFGGAPVASMPAGASETPLAPATPMAHPGAAGPGAPAPAAAGPGAPAPAATPAPAAGPGPGAPAPAAANVQPAPDFLTGPAATPAPAAANVQPAPDFLTGPAATPAPAAEVKYMHPDGNAYTESELIAAKWTVEQIHTLPVAQ